MLFRSRIELYGYIAAAVVMLVGMVAALYIYGATDHGNFMSWIFLVPMGLAGGIMWFIGRWSNRGRIVRK